MRSECSEYQVLDSKTRNSKSSHRTNYFQDKLGCEEFLMSYPATSDWKGPGWYRLLPPAWTVIPESSPGEHHYGVWFTGWVRGQHPVRPGQVSNTTICFTTRSDDCYQQVDAMITNCDSFFVYFLPKLSWGCGIYGSYGYCGADSL